VIVQNLQSGGPTLVNSCLITNDVKRLIDFYRQFSVFAMVTSRIHVLILVPVFFVLLKERALRRRTLGVSAENDGLRNA
jgi:hypothetical protein